MSGSKNKGTDRLKERIFPLIFSQNTELFSFSNCNFNMQKERKSGINALISK